MLRFRELLTITSLLFVLVDSAVLTDGKIYLHKRSGTQSNPGDFGFPHTL
jgi:hypothetical protein